jgi:hemoglobin
MMTDIQSRNDLEKIIALFYQQLTQDEFMYPFFQEIVEENTLESHLSVIVDFWEDILFHTHNYRNNPMQKHLDFHKKMKFSKEHFQRWLSYLNRTIDDHYQGSTSHAMKTRAASIAMVMQTKMNLYTH